jgi:uncharacterized protein (TIGR02145 family)
MNPQVIKGLVVFFIIVFGNTIKAQSVTDIDGNTYKTVQIGNQVWMAENLKTTRLNNGVPIKNIIYNNIWIEANYPAYCWYDNNKSLYGEKFGALYNWYVVETGRLCPNGWHVPSKLELETLYDYLIRNGYNYDGSTQSDKLAKSLASKSDWLVADFLTNGMVGYNQSQNNTSGFNGLPAGNRSPVNGNFGLIGAEAVWWASTRASDIWAYYFAFMYFDSVVELDHTDINVGSSVRCIKN